MTRALRKYIQLMVAESMSGLGVASQLKDPASHELKDEEVDADELDEFSGVGAIAGFTAPLGYSSMDVEGPGAKGSHSRRKSPKWF